MPLKNTHIKATTGTNSISITLAIGSEAANGKMAVIDFLSLATTAAVATIDSIDVTIGGLVLFKANGVCGAGEGNTVFVAFDGGLPCSALTDTAGTYTNTGRSVGVTINYAGETIENAIVGYHYEPSR